MHDALVLIARAIGFAHDRWRRTVGRRRPLSGKIAFLEERVQRLEAEDALLRARFLRVPGLRRPHYRRHERLEILWHAARYGLSIAATAAAFCVTRQTILNWRSVMYCRNPHLLPPIRGLPELVHELVHRLKAEWPRWGTRRIAGQLARLGMKASHSSVQRILRRRPRSPTEPENSVTGPRGRVLLAKYPDHVWMIDFTRIGGLVRPLWIGAVIDAFSRKVLAIGAVRGAPSSAFATRLLQRAMRPGHPPRWLVTDKDPVLRGGLVQQLLTRRSILRRYGAVGKKGAISLIERFWRSTKQEYVRHLFLYRSVKAIDAKLLRYQTWFNSERPHQGIGQRTPDDVYFDRPAQTPRSTTDSKLHVRFLDGDRRLPILRLHRAA